MISQQQLQAFLQLVFTHSSMHQLKNEGVFKQKAGPCTASWHPSRRNYKLWSRALYTLYWPITIAQCYFLRISLSFHICRHVRKLVKWKYVLFYSILHCIAMIWRVFFLLYVCEFQMIVKIRENYHYVLEQQSPWTFIFDVYKKQQMHASFCQAAEEK